MDLRGFRMTVRVEKHPEYRGLGDYFGTGKPRPKRSGIRRTLDQWVVFAEALAKEHDGILPSAGWIEKNYPGLAFAMWKHPDRFEHIQQEHPRRTYRTLDQSVVFAESLAKEYGGVLPCVNWLQKNHKGLAFAMRKHPKRFEHIPQEKPQGHYCTLDQWVVFAKALTEERGGALPCCRWIWQNHSGLGNAMRKAPELFTGLRQEIRDNRGRVIGHRILGTRESS